jgi:hypothetical protein
MVLTVPYDEFPEAVKRIEAREIFVSEKKGACLVTAANPQKDVIVAATTSSSFEEAKAALETKTVTVFRGEWSGDDVAEYENGNGETTYIAAVAYRSNESMPGLWVDAFPTMPTPQIVLKSLYDEFRDNSEIGNVSYEEFIGSAHPNVVILSPSEIATYLKQKDEC